MAVFISSHCVVARKPAAAGPSPAARRVSILLVGYFTVNFAVVLLVSEPETPVKVSV